MDRSDAILMRWLVIVLYAMAGAVAGYIIAREDWFAGLADHLVLTAAW